MLNVYSHDEIVAFVGAKLKKIGTGAMNDPKLNRAFVDMISVLPPAFAVILIESGHDSVIGDFDEINRAFKIIDIGKEHESINGFFSSGEIRIDNLALKSPSVIRSKEFVHFSLRTARHEKGHDIDYILGKLQSAGKGPVQFFSALSEEWQDALKREIGHQSKEMAMAEKSPEEILNLPKETMESLVAAYKNSGSLYDEYRPLLQHLSYYSTKKSRTLESFAEMCVHYTTLFEKTGGIFSSIDMRLSKRYPELWPHFRDEVLPRIEETAQELVNTRRDQIVVYAIAEENVADSWGLPYKQDRSFREAAIALANGTFKARIKDFARLEKFFKNPIGNYAVALRARDDLYYEHDPDSVRYRDYAPYRAMAMDVLRANGKAGLGSAFLHVDQERRSFEKFIAAYDSRLAQISPDYTIDTYFEVTTPKDTAVTYFKRIFDQGGEEAIRKHIEQLPSASNVAGFHESYMAWQKMVHALERKPFDTENSKKFMTEQSVLRLRELIESRQYNATQVFTAAVNNDRTALSQYALGLHDLYQNMRKHTENGIEDLSGSEILQRYERIKSRSGLDGVRTKIERLKISSDDIKGYVDARTSFWDWSRASDRHGKNITYVNHNGDIHLTEPSRLFPAKLYAKIALDILKAVSHGGVTALRRLQKNEEAQTLSIKRRAQGIEDIPDPLQAWSKASQPDDEIIDEGMLRAMRVVVTRGFDIQ